MKPESSPIDDDEWLLRIVFEDRFRPDGVSLSPRTFEPREGRSPDTDGISLFRESCLDKPADVLAILPEDKKPKNGVVRIKVSLLKALGFTVEPKKDEKLPGHVVVPQLNIDDYKKNKKAFTPKLKTLADAAHANIVLRPIQSPPADAT